MLVFLTVISMLCGYTAALLCTRSPTSEDTSHCYEASRVLCNNYTEMNRDCEENTVTLLIYDRDTGSYNFIYGSEFQTADFQPEITYFRLCHREALDLTQNDLKCGNQCSVRVNAHIQNTFVFTCNDLPNLVYAGLTIILFKMKTDMLHVHTCVNQTKYRFAVVDTRGKH